MKILLVSIPLELPLANYCLAAQLAGSSETADCQIELLNLDTARMNRYNRKSSEIWRYVARVEEWRPDVVAFSVYLWSHLATRELVSLTRRLYPQVAVVIGGPEVATPEAAEPWLGDGVSAVVRGPGELTFVELVSRLGAGDRPAGVMGCSWRDGSSIVHEPKRPVGDLSELVSPYLTGWLPDDLLQRANAGGARRAQFPRALLETYRGCYMQCSYCQWGNGDKSRASFPLGRVKGELSWILERRLDNLMIVDAMFGFKKELAKDLLRHIIEQKAVHGAATKIDVYHNQDFFDPELLELYREANVSVEVDLQSTDPAVLSRVGRERWSTESFERHLAAFHEQRVPTSGHADLIIGLPRETLDTFARSIDYLLERNMRVNLYQTSIIPDTPMSRSLDEDGIVSSEIPPRAVFRNTTFTTAGMIKARLMGHGVELFDRFPHLAQLLSRSFARPSDFCLHFGQLLWDRHQLMYCDTSANSPGLDGFPDLVWDLLPELCPDWQLGVVRDLFQLQRAALALFTLPSANGEAPHLRGRRAAYGPGDAWLSDRPRLRDDAVLQVRLERRVDRLLQTWSRTGVMPSDDDLRAVELEPAVALVYLHARRNPRYRIVDLVLTHPILQRLRGDFTIAECLESLGRRQNRTWGADELLRLRESLSVLIVLGMLQTELPDPIARATADLTRRAPAAVVLEGGV